MNKKICIVDDQPSLRKMVRFALSVQGLDVLEAQDGIEALDILSEHCVDLVIADWQMSKLDGLELLQRMRSIDQYSEIPVVMVSAKDDLNARKRARELGALTWLKKPFRIAEIQSIVMAGLAGEAVGATDPKVANGSS